MKVSKGKLNLRPDPQGWVDRASRRPGFSFLPLDREILLRSTSLPGEVHGDPADRILMASAALSGMPLLTADPLILDYAAREGTFTVWDVRP
jgi:PIN domain nuclease of toxin-antitoxin system